MAAAPHAGAHSSSNGGDDSLVPGSVLETVVTPAKLGFLAYRCPDLTQSERSAVGKWLSRAAVLCRTKNTCFLCDVLRLACEFLKTPDPENAFTIYGFALPARSSGILNTELPSDAESAWQVLVGGDTRDDVVSLILYRFCRIELRTRYHLRQTVVHPADELRSGRLFQLLERFSSDVTFSAHGDRYLHMYVQLLCASWASTVTRSREPAFKAAEAQYGIQLNDILRPLIAESPADQLRDRAREETARSFCLIAGLLLELVPLGVVAIDHEVLWVDRAVPTLFWLSDFGIPDCYGIAYNNTLHCFNGRGVLCAAAEWLFMLAVVRPDISMNAALYVYQPSGVPASSPISKYL